MEISFWFLPEEMVSVAGFLFRSVFDPLEVVRGEWEKGGLRTDSPETDQSEYGKGIWRIIFFS